MYVYCNSGNFDKCVNINLFEDVCKYVSGIFMLFPVFLHLLSLQ